MAHASGTPIRLQRLTALVAICLVAAAVGFAFGRILVGHGATYRMLAVALASGVIAWATERRGMVVATVVSAVGLVLAVTWLAAPQTVWFGLPTSETLRTIGTLATQVGGQAREYVSPAPMTPALLLAGTVAVWAAVFSCYALAFRAQSPLLGLVPPLALIVFADSVLEEFIRPMYGILFLIAALAVLFADSLRRIQGWGPIWTPTGNRDRLLPIAGRNARRVGLTAVTVALIAPVLVPGFGEKAVFSLSSINSDHRVRLSPLVQMSAILNGENGDTELFSIETNKPSYWRMVTLNTNDGTTWQPALDTGVPVASGAQIPNVTVPLGRTVTQTITVLQDGGFSWLVAGATPTSITIDQDVSWHPASSSLQMEGWPDAGESYTVTSVQPNVSAKSLEARQASVEPDELTNYPDTMPSVIQEQAREWTAGLSTDFDRVQAIRQHLSAFIYDKTVTYGDDPASLAFMLTQSHRGFCQQFASLMAIMLRSIGIPARVAVGFTTGQTSTATDGGNAYVVRLKDYHSWVEVPFQGVGWLPFDPTPTFPGDPSVSYARAGAVGDPTCPAPSRGCASKGNGKQSDGGTNLVTRKEAGTEPLNVKGGTIDGPTGPNDDTPIPLGPLALAGLVVALLAAIGFPLLNASRRRRKLHAAHEPRELILATYDVFADRAAELGWPRAPGETPEEYRGRLRSVEGLDKEDQERLTRMTRTVVRAAYAPGEPDATVSHQAADDAREVLHALRDTASWKQRLMGMYRRD